MSHSVCVRFAISPSAIPHVGNLRTALFNWLLARRHGSSFIVRRVEDAVEAAIDSLRWLCLDWDEGPEVGASCTI